LILLDPSARPIVAHRGGMGGAPENTLAAFARAISEGAEAFELDVRLSADGHVIVCHDATVDRTTEGRGAVDALPLAELRQLNAAARWQGAAFAEQRLPLLAEVLDAFPSIPIIIELKSTAVGAATVEVVRMANATRRVVLGSFDNAPMEAPRAAGLPTLASQRELVRLLPRVIASTSRVAVPFAAISMSPRFHGVPIPISRYVRATQVPVHVWTVNDPAQPHRLWRAGAHGIVTDYPAVMVEARRRSS
jgi:glycerophosphoryl diester phosphodiesterase